MTDNIYINEKFKIIGFTNGSCKLTFDCKTNNNGICELQRYGGRQKYLNNILQLTINNKNLVYKINKVEFLSSKKYKLYVDDIYFNTDYIPNEFNELSKMDMLMPLPNIIYITQHDEEPKYYFIRNRNYTTIFVLSI